MLCVLATLPVGFSRPFFEDIEKIHFFDVDPLVSLFVAVGRERDTFECAGVNPIRSVNPFSFCHHNSLMLWQNSQNQELAMHIHHFLALSAKSYNDTA